MLEIRGAVKCGGTPSSRSPHAHNRKIRRRGEFQCAFKRTVYSIPLWSKMVPTMKRKLAVLDVRSTTRLCEITIEKGTKMQTHVPIHPTQKWRSPGAKALRQFCVAVSIYVLGIGPTAASIYSVNVASGTSGSPTLGQSYNETRAVDVTVLSPLNLAVTSMTLSGVGNGLATAVIYDSISHTLVASAQGTLTGGTITLPISATLISGDEYRIGFYGLFGSGNGFIPSGWTINKETPFTESTGLLRINSAWDDTLGNGFPSIPNLEVPLVSMQVTTVPEPGAVWLVGLGLLFSMRFHKRKATGHFAL